MLSASDQNLLRQRLERDLASRLRVDVFTQKPSPIIIPGRQECAYCEEVETLMKEVASLSPRIALSLHDIEAERALAAGLGVDKAPATVLRGAANRPLRFFGLPSGPQFPNLVEIMVDAARGKVALLPDTVTQLRKLKTDVRLQVFVTTTCPHSPLMVRTAARFALQSVRIKLDIIEIEEYPVLFQQYGIPAVPATLIGEKWLLPGVMDEQTLAQQVLRFAEGRPLDKDLQPGAFTPLDPNMFRPKGSQPSQPATSTGGIILPR
ncbi:MAG: hypothetical protein GEU75_12815 [Dehalococcoidia bacterium]|nr:hypothetical protein [Dehalococcoidia bacterium]